MSNYLTNVKALIFICFGILLLSYNSTIKELSQSPNLVVMYADDQRYDALGIQQVGSIKTPNRFTGS
ncbi:MAG: hypothetical protein HKN87_00910 [Saprospiraceae bacterium]|nr:hypothetical protein [Saprospiraceae bacterium]